MPELHRSICSLPNDDADLAKGGVFVWIIVAELSPATFLAFQRGTGHGFRYSKEVHQVERGVPARVVFAVARHTDFSSALAKFLQPLQRARHFLAPAHHADPVLHQLLQALLDLVRTFAIGAALEWPKCFADRLFHLAFVHPSVFLFFCELASKLSPTCA